MPSVRILMTSLVLCGCVTDWQVTDKPADLAEPLDTDAASVPEVPVDVPQQEEEEPPPVQEETPPVPDPVEEEPIIDDPPPVDDCTTTSDLIYTLSRDDDGIYLFNPNTLTRTLLGRLDCTPWGTPASMAVARDGVAYVRYSDNSLYEVDLDTMDCSTTAYQPGSFGGFGMGFATDTAGTWRDSLYVANSHQLARLGTQGWGRTVLGGLPSQAELTGNAAGELYGLLPLERPAVIVRVGKGTGQILDTLRLPGFPDPGDIDTFAFAAWGGDFYLFVRTYGMGSSTDIYQVTAQGQMILLEEDIGLDIVGAGASTCAPW